MGTKIGQRAQELSRLNPWWSADNWEALDPDLREVTNAGLHYRSTVLADLRLGSLYILRGPRRVGKTVALKQKISELVRAGVPPTSIVRVAADGWTAKDIRTVVQHVAIPLVPPGTVRTWFFDEISAVSGDWAQEIKWLRDNDLKFRASTVVLTGSNATALTRAAGELAGRRGTHDLVDRTLLPIGFRTFVQLTSTDDPPDLPQIDPSLLRSPGAALVYNKALAWLDLLVTKWELYIHYGGFPRAVSAVVKGQPLPRDFVEDIFNVIAGDAFLHSRLSTAVEMSLIERLWSSMASPANLTTISEDLGLSKGVVPRHVEYLADSYLLWRCPLRAESAWVPLSGAQEKLYAVDPIVARLAHLRNNERLDIDPTVLTEMQLGMAIRRSIVRGNPSVLGDEFLFYQRTPARKEIDFIARDLCGTAVEGKYVEDGRWKSEAATVEASGWQGIMCTRNVLDTNGDGAWAVPAGILAYVLDD